MLALLIGLILGLLGGGGAMLAVPIMVFLMNIEEITATGYSLFVVGATSLVGALMYWQQHPQQGKTILHTALSFAPPTIIIGVFIRKIIKNYIPEVLFIVNHYELRKGFVVMILFAIIMLIVAKNMIKPTKNAENTENPPLSPYIILWQGIKTGLVAGISGAGAGFLITPILVKYLKFPMKMAVGISLWIIAANSWFIFFGDLIFSNKTFAPNWQFLLIFTAIAIAGILLGNRLTKYISNEKLKPAFGYFVLVMAFVIIITEIYK